MFWSRYCILISQYRVTSWFDSVCVIAARWEKFRLNVNLNINYSFQTIMYESNIGIHTVVMSRRAGTVTYHEKKFNPQLL